MARGTCKRATSDEGRVHGLPVAPGPSPVVPSRSWFFFAHLAPTREGWYWLVIAALLLAIGVIKVINLLVLLAYLMIALWALNALLAGPRLRQLHVERFLP